MISKFRNNTHTQAGKLLRACVPVPKEHAGAQLRMKFPDGTFAFLTQSDLVYTPDHGAHGAHAQVEVSTITPKAWVAGSKFELELDTRPHTPYGLSMYEQDSLAAALDGSWGVEIALMDGTTAFQPLGFQAGGRWHRRGPYISTYEQYVDTSFGTLTWWLTVRAGSSVVEVVVDWSNGAWRDASATPDGHLFFHSVHLRMPENMQAAAWMPDPCMHLSLGQLVAPMADGRAHVLPQRWQRSFRFGITVQAEFSITEMVEAYGIADYTQGGWLMGDFSMPYRHEQYKDYAENQAKNAFSAFAAGAKEGGNDHDPPSYLWMTKGNKYGGGTGGYELDQVPGAADVSCTEAGSKTRWYIDQLRYRCRQPGVILDATTALPPKFLFVTNTDGSAPWAMFDRTFEKQGGIVRDEKFNFSSAVATPRPEEGDYLDELLSFFPIDSQHLQRASRSNQVLMWLDNDPLAQRYLVTDGFLCIMGKWHRTGRGQKINAANYKPQLGTTFGRGEAWDMVTIGYAQSIASLSDEEELEELETMCAEWTETVLAISIVSQMPNGLLGCNTGGKVVKDPPFGVWDEEQEKFVEGPVAVQRSEEEAFLALALHQYRCSQEPQTLTLQMVAKQLLALAAFCWDTDNFRAWHEKIAVGERLGAYRYVTRGEIPEEYWQPNAVYTAQAGLLAYLLFDFGMNVEPEGTSVHLLEAANCTAAYAGTTGTDNPLRGARDVMATWNPANGNGGATCDSWAPLQQVLNRVITK